MKKKVIFIGGGLAALGGMFVLGYKFGEHNLVKTIIDQYENGDNNMVATDNKTGLIYEIFTECIGD